VDGQFDALSPGADGFVDGQSAGHARNGASVNTGFRGQDRHQRPGEEPGHGHVEHRRQAEEEGEARTEPTVSHHSTAAPRNDEVSAARMVRQARLKARSVLLRRVLPP